MLVIEQIYVFSVVVGDNYMDIDNARILGLIGLEME